MHIECCVFKIVLVNCTDNRNEWTGYYNRVNPEVIKKDTSLLTYPFSRFQADSNRCKRFCRPVPNHSDMEPFLQLSIIVALICDAKLIHFFYLCKFFVEKNFKVVLKLLSKPGINLFAKAFCLLYVFGILRIDAIFAERGYHYGCAGANSVRVSEFVLVLFVDIRP